MSFPFQSHKKDKTTMNQRNRRHETSSTHKTPGIPDSRRNRAKKKKTEHTRLSFIEEKTGKNPYRLAKQKGQPPNIFLITMDMVSPDFYHPSRPLSRVVNLPALRAMMNDGVVFRNAFAPVPLCGPSRASYLTGRYTYVLGNGEHAPDGLETELRPDDVIFPEYLKAIGYVTKQCGKSHVGTRKFIDAFGENVNPWDQWYPPVYQDEYYLEYQRRLGVKPQKYSREIVFLQRDRKTAGNSVGGWIVQDDDKPFPLEAQYSYYLAHRALDKLEHALTSPATRGRPVYLQLDIFDPHQPFSVPEGFEEREKQLRAVMTLPETYKKVQARDWRPFPNQPRIYDIYREYWGLYNPQSLVDYRVAHALQMEVVDRALAHLIEGLKEKNLYDESLIVLMGDHGEMNGRWALVDKGVYLYPDVLRTPLVVKMPASMDIPPHVVDAPVSLLDVAPTLLSVAGIEPEARLDGESLIPHLDGTARPADRDMVFSSGWHIGVNFACGIQRWEGNGDHHLYVYNVSSAIDELYDLNAVEAENLAQEAQYAALKKEMINRLGRLLQSDPRWRGYWSSYRLDKFFELPKISGSMQLFDV